MPVPVLIRRGNDRQLVTIPVEPSQATAGDLKAQVAQLQGVPVAAVTQVVVQGQPVGDGERLSSVGVAGSRATLQAASCQLFPNAWFDLPGARAYLRVRDTTWPPLRQADFAASFGWVLAALAALFAANAALGS